MFEHIQNELNAHKSVVEKTLETLQSHIYTASIIITETVKNNNKIYIFGNGKNSIIAQYLASSFGENMSLNVATITEIANNDGFDKIYDKQIKTKAKNGDLLIGISTSGNSKNILRGLSLGKNMGCKTIGLSGYDGGAMSEFCDINITVPSDDVTRIHEGHFLIATILNKYGNTD